jgi:hypothetical protein
MLSQQLKVKVMMSQYMPYRCEWGEDVYLLLILDLSTRGGWVSGQHHAPVTLYPQESTLGIHWTGVSVGLRAHLTLIKS